MYAKAVICDFAQFGINLHLKSAAVFYVLGIYNRNVIVDIYRHKASVVADAYKTVFFGRFVIYNIVYKIKGAVL